MGGIRLSSNAFRIRAPETPQDWADYYTLRWRILRAPWGQPPGSERDQFEDSGIHRMVCDTAGRVVAVGRMHDAGDHTAQIRYMAVDTGYQRQGLGSRILQQLEQAAAGAGYDRIVLHARELAVPFYLSRGYRIIEPSHRLFGTIRHYRMSRRLGVAVPHS